MTFIAPSLPLQSAPANHSFELLNDKTVRRLLVAISLTMVLGGCISLVQTIHAPWLDILLGGGAYALLGGTMLLLVAVDRVRWSVAALLWGVTGIAFSRAFMHTGLYAPILYWLPVVCMCTSWLFDARHGLILWLAMGAGLLALCGLHLQGAGFQAPQPLVSVLALGTASLLASALGATSIALFRAEYRRAAALTSDLQAVMQWQIARHMAAALAHEINQPLTSVSALVESISRLSRSAAGADNPGRLETVLRQLEAESQRASRVVRHLVDSLQAPDINRQPVALASLLEDAVREEILSTRFHGHDIVLARDGELPLLQADPVYIRKAAQILVQNAVDAMSGAGQTRGRVSVRVGWAADRQHAIVTVQDQGPGLDPAVARQVFHPRFSTKHSGLGMGLSIARSLVEAHGGKLWHDETAQHGATFCFTLPLAA